jgi:hypothetical protein
MNIRMTWHISNGLLAYVKLLWFLQKEISLSFIVVVNQSAFNPMRLNAMTQQSDYRHHSTGLWRAAGRETHLYESRCSVLKRSICLSRHLYILINRSGWFSTNVTNLCSGNIWFKTLLGHQLSK